MGLFDTKVPRMFGPLWRFEIAISHTIDKGGPKRFTRAELWTDLNRPEPFPEATFKRYMSRCLKEGVFEAKGFGKSTGGRPPQYYRVNLKAYNRQLEKRFTQEHYRGEIRETARRNPIVPLLVPRFGFCRASLFTLEAEVEVALAEGGISPPGERVETRARRMERALADAWPWLASELRTGEMIVIGPFWKLGRARRRL
jgi:hypothetical protein